MWCLNLIAATLINHIQIMAKGSVVIISSALLYSLLKFMAEVLAWRWRRALVTYTQDRYFRDLLFYKMLILDSRVDNPSVFVLWLA